MLPARAHAGHRTFDLVLDDVGIDQAREAAVFAMMIPDLAGMRARRHQHRSVGEVAIVQQHADREHVVIGVRIERPVLMPLHRRAVLCRLHVELGAVQPQAGTDQLLEDVEHRLRCARCR